MSRFSAPCEDRITAVFSPGNSVSGAVALTALFLLSAAGCGFVVSSVGLAAEAATVEDAACGVVPVESAEAGVEPELEVDALAGTVVVSDAGGATAGAVCVLGVLAGIGVGTGRGAVACGCDPVPEIIPMTLSI